MGAKNSMKSLFFGLPDRWSAVLAKNYLKASLAWHLVAILYFFYGYTMALMLCKSFAALGMLTPFSIKTMPKADVNLIARSSKHIQRAAHALATSVQHVRINHGRAHLLMPQQFLHRANVVTRF